MNGTFTDNSFLSASAFEELYAKYRAYFVRIALSYVRERMAAEDLVSEAFIKVWEERASVSAEQFPGRMYVVLRSRCLNWLRDRDSRQRIQERIHKSEQRILSERLSRMEATDPHALLMSEALEIVRRELERMPERRRRIFLAHRYEEMPYREIAAVYELSEGQISYEIRAAKQALKVALKDFLPVISVFVGL